MATSLSAFAADIVPQTAEHIGMERSGQAAGAHRFQFETFARTLISSGVADVSTSSMARPCAASSRTVTQEHR